MKTCSIEGCEKRHLSKGFCNMHYIRWRKGDLSRSYMEARAFSLEDAFWRHVDKTSDLPCWRWRGPVDKRNGYGAACFRGEKMGAHVFSFKIHGGTPVKGMHVGHTCDNGWCVNPEHLVLQTPQENMVQMVAHGRHNHAKIDNEIAKRIITETGTPMPQLALELGLPYKVVWRVRRGHTWRHVAP